VVCASVAAGLGTSSAAGKEDNPWRGRPRPRIAE
jgi:hypothetical protein